MGKRLLAMATIAGLLVVEIAGTAEAAPGDLTLVSTSDSGVKGNNISDSPVLSADGTRVAFASYATNLDAADTDRWADAYVNDLVTGDLILASTSDAGADANSDSYAFGLSADGTKVAIQSIAQNLDPGDSDTNYDVYVKDLLTGEIVLVSTSESGSNANADSLYPSLSADGTRVSFWSEADNLDPADTDEFADVYVKDVVTGDLVLVSTSDSDVKANGHSVYHSLSADGRFVAFQSLASNLDPTDTDGFTDIYVKDLVTGDIVLASTSDGGIKANTDAGAPILSADGTRVSFVTAASNLDPADTDDFADIYVKDMVTGDVVLATTSDSDVKANGHTSESTMSGDGTRVAFWSEASNLDPADTDGFTDVYVKDLVTGDLVLVSMSEDGVKANSSSFHPSLSADGTRVAFRSDATNLDPADTDFDGDVYLKELPETGSSADLSVSQRDMPNLVFAGGRLAYAAWVENLGPGAATGVTLVDRLPAGVRFVRALTGQGECLLTRRLLTCHLGSLASGDQARVRVVVVPIRPGVLRNIVHVTADQTDPNIANNADIERTRIRPRPTPPYR
jgi:uncharacterized repeat protein (TIGR01451 family)